jgi:hypothetical protein
MPSAPRIAGALIARVIVLMGRSGSLVIALVID